MGIIQRLKQTKLRRTAIGILLVSLVAAVAIHIYFRFHLAGDYDFLEADCAWVFKDGQIYEVTEQGQSQIGNYSREGFRWCCRPVKGMGGGVYVQPCLLGLWWPDPRMTRGGAFMPRRCFSPFAATLYDWHIRI